MTRNEWIGTGLAVVTLGVVATVLIVSEKKASAAPANSPAVAMNNAIAARGLVKSDQPIYEAFQTSAGIPVDGFVGPQTVAALRTALQSQGLTLSPNALNPSTGQPYPWLPGSSGGCSGYDGSNAPPAAQWDPSGVC